MREAFLSYCTTPPPRGRPPFTQGFATMHSRAPLFRSAYNQWELPEAQRRHHMRLSSVKSTYSTQPSKRRRAVSVCVLWPPTEQAAVLPNSTQLNSPHLTSALHPQAAKTKTKFLVKLTDNTGSPLPQNAAPGRRRRRKGNRTARGPASSDKNLLAGAELTPRRPKQLQVCQLPPHKQQQP